jgi:hypothetical protein
MTACRPGFRIAFLQALDEAKRQAKDCDKLTCGERIIGRQEWAQRAGPRPELL